jgi:hypothetical protein
MDLIGCGDLFELPVRGRPIIRVKKFYTWIKRASHGANKACKSDLLGRPSRSVWATENG